MAQVILNNKTYTIDDNVLDAMRRKLKEHLSTSMSGSGAVVQFDGVDYNVDSVKLQTATSSLRDHLTHMAGSGASIQLAGQTYYVDSELLSSAVEVLDTALNEMAPDSNITLVSLDNYILTDSEGLVLIPEEDN